MMQYTVAFLALAASLVSAQDSPGYENLPTNCVKSFTGTFEFATSGKSQVLPECNTNPIISLQNGVLTDQSMRQAEVVVNDQFQFDHPLQDKRLYSSGFSVCSVDSPVDFNNPAGQYRIAHGNGTTTWYQCKSGSITNLYDINIGTVCTQIEFVVLPCGSSSKPDASSAGTVTPGTVNSAVSSATSASSTMSSMASSSSSMMSSTMASTMASTVASTPSEAATTAAVAPYPTGNSTTPAASGTGAPSSTAPGTTTSSPITAPASGAETLAIGSNLVALAIVVVGFALW